MCSERRTCECDCLGEGITDKTKEREKKGREKSKPENTEEERVVKKMR
jgi:hypothetical protein